MADRRSALRPAATGILLALCGSAQAEGLNAWIEPIYDHIDTTTTDQTGRTTSTVEDHLTQQYRLNFDRTLTEFLQLNLGANLVDEHGWIGTNRLYTEASGRSTTYNGRLTLGTPVLNAVLSADRNQRQAYVSSGFAGRAAPTFVTESYTGTASWRPLDLPELDFRLGRVNEYDDLRLTRDATTDLASFTARYYTPTYDLRYLVNWNRVDDHRTLTTATTIEQTVLGSRSDRLLGGRTTTYVSATGHMGTSSNEQRGAGGTISKQQLPFSGLSAVEIFPATAEDIVLAPNPQLIDGNLTATAGVNVGYGPSASGDRDPRHVGAGFADAITPVNTIYVSFDKTLPAAVATSLATSIAVYRGDDNRRWTPVAILSPPAPSPFANRIEISIEQVQSRYLKVVLTPLAVGVTTDVAYRDLFVTELQFFNVLPASQVPTRQTLRGANATGTARTLLLKDPELTWDITGTVGREIDGPTTYTIVNGLTVSHRFSPTLAGNARGARVDENLGFDHEGTWQWSAGLVWKPVKAAYGTLAYSGYSKEGGQVQNAVSVLGRGDWWEGISTQGVVSVSRTTDPDRNTDAMSASGRLSLTPNPFLSMSVGGQYQRAFTSSFKFGDVFSQYLRADGSLSLSPAPALSATGTLSRILLGDRPTTLGTMTLSYFPLRGDLQLSAAYSKTFDTAAERTTEAFTPALRWNLSREVYIRSSYNYVRNDAAVLSVVSRAVEIALLVSL